MEEGRKKDNGLTKFTGCTCKLSCINFESDEKPTEEPLETQKYFCGQGGSVGGRGKEIKRRCGQ